jgi:hypothetical protein
MSRINSFSRGLFCSKIILYRFLLIFGIVFVSYLFIYKLDINTIVIRTRDFIVPVGQHRAPTIPIANTKPILTAKIDDVRQVLTVKNESNNTNISEQPKEAFVTFSNNQPSYLAVLKVLLDSVHAFSTRPIIAFGIDVDLDIDVKQYPRVIKRRIKQSDCGPVRFNSILQNQNNPFSFSRFIFVKSMPLSVVM